jgi:oligopeptide transport system substrate-binding protein
VREEGEGGAALLFANPVTRLKSTQKGAFMKRIRLRVFALAVVGGLAVFACGNSSSGTSETLAADQTLSFGMQDDVQYLDPGHASSAVDITFIQQVFSGLYHFDNTNKLVPDLATGNPDVSSDGKTYTFHLNKNAKFSNGDAVTSKDVIYSWNRGAYLNDSYASNLQPVVGWDDTSNNKTTTMSGLSAPDTYTVKAELTAPAGYWISSIALPGTSGWIVDQNVIGDYTDPKNTKNDTWWTQAATLIGSGPFTMTQRTAKASMDFAPVKNWWGGSTGALTKIHVDIGPDSIAQVKKFESGGYDLVGMANQPPASADVLRYQGDPTKKKLLTIWPAARTTWMGFNVTTGPFASKDGGTTPGQPTSGVGTDAGLAGRDAFSKAIDRNQLTDVACVKSTTCSSATGGVISKGLKGYLGDGADSSAKFDAAAAKSEYMKWDPTGSKVQGLKLDYNTSNLNDTIWGNVQSQLRANLGVNVALNPTDFPTLISRRNAKQSILFRGSWGADYDHPQDWFDNLFTCSTAAVGRGNDQGYCNPAMDKLINQADTSQNLTSAVSTYQQAQKLMIKDVAVANLFYGTQPYIAQTYVKGAGYTGLFDYRWEGIRILKH